MSGVIVSVKGRYAVLLTKNSDFIKVKKQKLFCRRQSENTAV